MLAQTLEHRGTPTVLLASGDPLWFGFGATLARHLSSDEFSVTPAASSFQLAAARLRWPLQHVTTLSLHARPPELVHPHVTPGNRILALTTDAMTASHVARLLAERGYGRLIHISSQQAHRAFVSSGVYGASKGAVESLMRSEAEAWGGTGVTSNTLVPGFVLTPLNARLQDDTAKVAELAARTMIGRNGLPDDFASAAVFLAGPGSAYVTGHSLFVDGGLSVH